MEIPTITKSAYATQFGHAFVLSTIIYLHVLRCNEGCEGEYVFNELLTDLLEIPTGLLRIRSKFRG